MSIDINITGDLWTALTAIGTIGACIIAIWGIWKGERKKLCGALIWDNVTRYVPKLIITNACTKTIVVTQVDFIFKSENIGMLNIMQDRKYRGNNVILPGSTVELEIPVFAANERDIEPGYRKFPCSGIYIDASATDRDKKEYIFETVITDVNKKKYKFKQSFSEDKLSELFIGNSVIND